MATTYIVEGRQYAAASLTQAMYAHRSWLNVMRDRKVKSYQSEAYSQPLTTEEAARKARTQPYYNGE